MNPGSQASLEPGQYSLDLGTRLAHGPRLLVYPSARSAPVVPISGLAPRVSGYRLTLVATGSRLILEPSWPQPVSQAKNKTRELLLFTILYTFSTFSSFDVFNHVGSLAGSTLLHLQLCRARSYLHLKVHR